MPDFGDKVIDFTRSLQVPELELPDKFEWIFPYENAETMRVLSDFYRKFYFDDPAEQNSAKNERIFIFGINPGRFGSGVTGVPFTDPIRLAEAAGIPNSFAKRPELSSEFVHRFIEAFGGLEVFCRSFYITSVVPLGFLREGKNVNYYDDRKLSKTVEPYAAWNVREQMKMGASARVAICLGEGQNFQFFSKLNEKEAFFDQILPLPHPRWVMQYRRKSVDFFVEKYLETLAAALDLAQKKP